MQWSSVGSPLEAMGTGIPERRGQPRAVGAHREIIEHNLPRLLARGIGPPHRALALEAPPRTVLRPHDPTLTLAAHVTAPSMHCLSRLVGATGVWTATSAPSGGRDRVAQAPCTMPPASMPNRCCDTSPTPRLFARPTRPPQFTSLPPSTGPGCPPSRPCRTAPHCTAEPPDSVRPHRHGDCRW
jgi:hypothetical protein